MNGEIKMYMDRFFYNNYSIVDDGRKVLVLGRNHIHEIDLKYLIAILPIGPGYEKLMS